jgi:hypothetical protein
MQQLTLFTGIFLLLGSAASARADYFFSFNTGLTEALGNQSNNIAIYMENTIGGACATLHNCVSVTPGVAVGSKPHWKKIPACPRPSTGGNQRRESSWRASPSTSATFD